MKHFIIVKLDDTIDVKKVIGPIEKLFNKSLSINGIDKVEAYVSNSNLPNRHDLMIEMTTTSNGLKEFDNSEIHKIWKSEYGKYIINKVIFDCD